jgi:hypothetical protein
MTDFTTNPGPPPTAEAPREPTDPDVEFLVNYADSLRRYAEQARVRGRVFGPECVDVQAPIFERIADRLRAASPSLGELGTLVDALVAAARESATAKVAYQRTGVSSAYIIADDKQYTQRTALDARLSALVAERTAAVTAFAEHLMTQFGSTIQREKLPSIAKAWLAAHPPEGSHGR